MKTNWFLWALRVQVAALCSYWVHMEIGLQLMNLCALEIFWSWWTNSLTFLSYQVEWVIGWFLPFFLSRANIRVIVWHILVKILHLVWNKIKCYWCEFIKERDILLILALIAQICVFLIVFVHLTFSCLKFTQSTGTSNKVWGFSLSMCTNCECIHIRLHFLQHWQQFWESYFFHFLTT